MGFKLLRAGRDLRRLEARTLAGDPRAALKARSILRELFGGKISLILSDTFAQTID
jgi:hypothetical protein